MRAAAQPKAVEDALTLDTYSHVMPGMQKEAASKLDQALGLASYSLTTAYVPE